MRQFKGVTEHRQKHVDLGNLKEIQLQGVKVTGLIQMCALYGLSLLVMCVHYCTALFQVYSCVCLVH